MNSRAAGPKQQRRSIRHWTRRASAAAMLVSVSALCLMYGALSVGLAHGSRDPDDGAGYAIGMVAAAAWIVTTLIAVRVARPAASWVIASVYLVPIAWTGVMAALLSSGVSVSSGPWPLSILAVSGFTVPAVVVFATAWIIAEGVASRRREHS